MFIDRIYIQLGMQCLKAIPLIIIYNSFKICELMCNEVGNITMKSYPKSTVNGPKQNGNLCHY